MKLKFVAQHRICGLLPPVRGKDGLTQHPEIALGEVVDLELSLAEPLVVCGALVAKNDAAYREAGGRPFNPKHGMGTHEAAVDGVVKTTGVIR